MVKTMAYLYAVLTAWAYKYGDWYAEKVSPMIHSKRNDKNALLPKHILQDISVGDSCRRCVQVPESIDHIIDGCSLLDPNVYKKGTPLWFRENYP